MLIKNSRWPSLFLFTFLVFSILGSVCCTDQSYSNVNLNGIIQASDSGLKFNSIAEINDDTTGYSRGNSNGLIDAGEKIEMRISIKNFESYTANNVVLSINCTNPFVVIDVKQVTIPLIVPDGVGTTGSVFQFYVKTGIEANTSITFNLNVTSTEGQWLHQSFTSTVFGVPSPEFVRYKVYSEQTYERSANFDGIINAGEQITADIYLMNNGSGYLMGASASLSCSDPFVGMVTTTNVSYSTLTMTKDGEKSARYTFRVSGATPDKRTFNFTLHLVDAYGMNYMIPFIAVLNGTPFYEVVNISISMYDNYYDSNYDFISKAVPGEEYQMKIFLRNVGTSLGKIQRIEIDCDDPYLELTGSKSYTTFYTTVEIGEIYSVETSSFDFKIKSTTLKGHHFTIRVKVFDERTREWSITNYEFEYRNGISISDLLFRRSPTILLMSIAIIGGVILMIPKVKMRIGDRRKTSILRVLFLYLFLISLIVFLGTEVSPYYFFGFLVLFYCTACSAGLAKSGVFRNLGKAWENHMERISLNRRTRKQAKREMKERKRQEKEERKETLPRLIALASKQTESAYAMESKNDFKGARSSWSAALTAYQKISKKGKRQDSQDVPVNVASMLKNVDSVRCNLGLSYVHEGIYLKNQAKEKLKGGNFAVSSSLYQEAANCFKQAREYFNKESDLAQKFPESVNLQKIGESELKYTKKAAVYKIQDELEVMKRQIAEIESKIGNKEKLIDLKNDSNAILKRAQNLKFELEKQNITILDAEMQSFLENLRSIQFKLDKKIDEMLGVVAVSKYSRIIDEEDEEEEEFLTNKEPSKSKAGKETTSAAPIKDAKEPEILREYEFLGGKVRFKVKLVNNTKEIFTDLKLTFTLPESLKWVAHEPEYPRKGDTIQIAKLGLQEQKTISLYLTPINCTGSPINATLTYFDSKDQPHAIPMKPKKVEISCPIFFTQEEANPARVKHMHQNLPIRDKKMLPIVEDVDINEQIDIAIKSITRHDVKFVEKVEATPIYEYWYFGTTKVKQKSMVIYLKIDTENSTMLIEVSGENHENITALLAEIEDQIRQEINSINPNYNEDSYLDVKTNVILGHCPYCFNPISPQAVKEYKSGKSVQCSYCKSDIEYYE
jgi:hypothetical protein